MQAHIPRPGSAITPHVNNQARWIPWDLEADICRADAIHKPFTLRRCPIEPVCVPGTPVEPAGNGAVDGCGGEDVTGGGVGRLIGVLHDVARPAG